MNPTSHCRRPGEDLYDRTCTNSSGLHVGVEKRFQTPKLAQKGWAKRYSRRDKPRV